MTAIKKTVLVVDDNPDLALTFSTALEDHGYRTREANSVDEARARLERELPDLITLDVMMPGKSGIAFYQELTRDQKYQDLPVIFISAFCMERDFKGGGFQKMLGPGESAPEPAAFLEKPLVLENLVKVVDELIGRH